jgi:hypothetical protein
MVDLDFLGQVFALIKEYLEDTVSGKSHVHVFVPPEEVTKQVDLPFRA